MYRNGNAVEFGGLHEMGLSQSNTQILKHLTSESTIHMTSQAPTA
jgi:hypothetical protein